MSILYNRLIEECEKKGITGYRLCKDCNVSPSVITDLKMGRKEVLSANNVNKFAKYLGVSVGYLIGQEEEEQKDILQDLCDTDRALLHSIVELTDDQKKMMQIFIRGLKGEENG